MINDIDSRKMILILICNKANIVKLYYISYSKSPRSALRIRLAKGDSGEFIIKQIYY